MAFRPSLEKKEEKERVRHELLRAALRLSATHGFASLGLREVAREAGIAPTSFYRHFTDMVELGGALVRELVARMLADVGARALAAPRAELGAVLADEMLRAATGEPELMRFVVAERVGALGELRKLLAAELSVFAATLAGALSAPSSGHDRAGMAADALIALLFDGCAKALDAAGGDRAVMRERLLWGLERVLDLNE